MTWSFHLAADLVEETRRLEAENRRLHASAKEAWGLVRFVCYGMTAIYLMFALGATAPPAMYALGAPVWLAVAWTVRRRPAPPPEPAADQRTGTWARRLRKENG